MNKAGNLHERDIVYVDVPTESLDRELYCDFM